MKTDTKTVVVSVLMGSDSDLSVMEGTVKTLKDFSIGFEVRVLSAHRTPVEAAEYAEKAASRGIRVIIAGAGAAAHLAGVIASKTILPVIGVPIDSSPLNGVDALYSTVQMPGGIPVATVAIGKAGAVNAALLAVEILALSDDTLSTKLLDYRKELRDSIKNKQKSLEKKIKNI